jgi:hypothetical protein
MSSVTVTCREIWYTYNVLWDEVNQINYVDPSTPQLDYGAVCALTVDGKMYLSQPVTIVDGTDNSQQYPIYHTTGQFTEAWKIFYVSSNETSVQSELSGLVGLVTNAYTVEYGV